jgi:hypothetical protein
VQGSPGGEGAERDNLDTPSHRIPRVLTGTEKMNSGESNVQKNERNPANNLLPSPNQPPDFFEATGPARGYIPRAGPVGSVWGLAPGRMGALGIPPDYPPGPASRDRKVSRGPVEAEGGLGGDKYGPSP